MGIVPEFIGGGVVGTILRNSTRRWKSNGG
jgi:hypothetical protein